MFRRRLSLLIPFIFGLLLLFAVFRTGNDAAAAENDELVLISEMTGMIATHDPSAPACVYSTEYQLYLCPEPEPAIFPQANPLMREAALSRLTTVGLLLIPESTNDRVMAFDPVTGDLVDPDFIPADPDNLSTPIHAIAAADGSGFLVSDQLDDVVQEYDIAGNYVGIFAPSVGVSTSILNNIRGIALRPNGNLLVTVGSAPNADAVAEFDTAGNYLGNFVANGSGGLVSPFDVIGRLTDYLVAGITSDAIHIYSTTGAYEADLTAIDTFPEQMHETAGGNVLVGNFSGTEEGVVEYQSDGTLVGIYDPASLGGYRGAYELPNGNILTTNGGGVHEIDRSGNLVETKIGGVSARFIEYVAASMAMTQTVAPGADTCGMTQSTTVAVGSPMSFCYTISNVGDLMLDTHTVTDTVNGTLADDLSYMLLPGDVFSFTVTFTPTVEALVSNCANWTAGNGGITMTEQSCTTVDVIVPTDVSLIEFGGESGGGLLWAALLSLGLGGLALLALRRRTAA